MSFALVGYPRSRKNGGHSAFRDHSLDSLPDLSDYYVVPAAEIP
jgi:hypothetical protein